MEFYAYAGELLGRRRAEPGDDLISALIAAEQEGDRLSDVETLNLVLNVLVGGVDTTQSQLAHALRLFAEHPEQWALLAENPLLAPAAVEEVVRFEPITPFTARIAMEDVTYRDVEFPEGTVVLVSAFTGNREGTAEGFDITADRTGAKPLTFGAGVHYCLGANLARAEMQEALAFLAPRMPGPGARRRPGVRVDRRHLRARRAAGPLGRPDSGAALERDDGDVVVRQPGRRAQRLDQVVAERLDRALEGLGGGAQPLEALVDRLAPALHQPVRVEQDPLARRQLGLAVRDVLAQRQQRRRGAAAQEARRTRRRPASAAAGGRRSRT